MYHVIKLEDSIKKIIKNAYKNAVKDGVLPDAAETEALEIALEVPKAKDHGDYSTNFAMQATKILKKSPRDIAKELVNRIPLEGVIESVEIAGPGFINFKINNTWLKGIFELVEEMGERYGSSDIGKGERVQVEFVSANPTGPMHLGNAKGGAIGDSLANLLKYAGYNVSKEFYINDAGNQIIKFGKSLEARYLEIMGQAVEFPEDGYQGENIIDSIKEFLEEHNGEDYLNMDSEERCKIFAHYCVERNIERMKSQLKQFGIEYDVWYRESSLYETGKIDDALNTLNKRNNLYEKDGAKWFKSSEFGGEKDEVMVRANGIPTYFAADIAYHKDKFDRGFDRVIDIWGADHHGHVARVKGAMDAIGIDSKNLDIIIIQLVRLWRGGEVVRMSKRTGKIISLADLIEEVGKDSARFIFNMKSPEAHTEFDLELAVKESSENPVFYVQYAHARICSIIRQALNGEDAANIKADVTILNSESEIELLKKVAEFPKEVAHAAKMHAPNRITTYVMELASAFHSFYNSSRVITDNKEVMNARIKLINSTIIVIKNCLGILGISAPERM